MGFIDVGAALVVAFVCTSYSRYYLHMLQLESYQLDGYRRWMAKHREKMLGWTLNVGVLASVANVALWLILSMFLGTDAAEGVATVITLIVFSAVAMRLFVIQYKIPEKKPFVLTARMKRLYSALALIALAVSLMLAYLGLPPFLLFIGVPYLALVAGFVMGPIERRVNEYYLNDAKRKLEGRADLIRIGITGSYGKTSTKFILQAILSEKFDVLATPSSFNTPMGLTRVIRERLEDHHQVFLAEMGARHAGDIAELIDLVHPTYGVLTSVGEQHLETFGDIETVANTKYELLEGLPADGVAFFAADGGWCDKLFARYEGEKYRAGLSGGYLSMYAEEIQVGSFGSRFILCDGEGNRVHCQTRLLGQHNIQNIALCAAVARRLGLGMEEIARGISKAQPVEHRLQLIPGARDITIIDDAFNSNPVGASAALEVLNAFPGRHLIVTPGMVEQGKKEWDINYRFGVQLASVCDLAILVGPKRTEPIRQGALHGGMAREDVISVADLSEATAVLGRVGRSGDVVLFENDLPDNYSE
ncbi:MAG: Mur ligase family protein [Candidatus Excrementavichristensenella sp.]|jgi:UDP-N-acetylmuramoyl-tripeptide--D-alanyl-D-alanine ligase